MARTRAVNLSRSSGKPPYRKRSTFAGVSNPRGHPFVTGAIKTYKFNYKVDRTLTSSTWTSSTWSLEHGLTGLCKTLKVFVPTDEYTMNKDNRHRGPSCPHLDGIAQTPATEVTAEFKVLEGNPSLLEECPGTLGKRVLLHANHHYRVLVSRAINLLNRKAIVVLNEICNRRMNPILTKYMSTHAADPLGFLHQRP